MPTVTPSANLTAEQFAEQFRRMMWGIMRLERIGDEAVKEEMRSIGDLLAERIGPDWRTLVTAKNTRTIAAMLRGIANAPGATDGSVVVALFRVLKAGLDYGHTVVNADTDFRLGVATAQMDFWARMNELADLPADAVKRIVTGAASVVTSTLGAAANIIKGPLIIIGLAVLALATVGKEIFGKGARQ